jgi:hypothetical protein
VVEQTSDSRHIFCPCRCRTPGDRATCDNVRYRASILGNPLDSQPINCVRVIGSLHTRSWEDRESGQKRFKTVVCAEDVVYQDARQDAHDEP